MFHMAFMGCSQKTDSLSEQCIDHRCLPRMQSKAQNRAEINANFFTSEKLLTSEAFIECVSNLRQSLNLMAPAFAKLRKAELDLQFEFCQLKDNANQELFRVSCLQPRDKLGDENLDLTPNW